MERSEVWGASREGQELPAGRSAAQNEKRNKQTPGSSSLGKWVNGESC